MSLCIDAARDRQAQDIQVLDLNGLTDVADLFLICSANTSRQAKVIADQISNQLEKNNIKPDHLEGYPEHGWILMDYGEMIIHIFSPDQLRKHYDLESLWADAERLPTENCSSQPLAAVRSASR